MKQNLPEDFALQLFNFWHLGQKDKNYGVLLIVAPSEHKVRIEVGYGHEQRLTNAVSSKIIESIISQFRVNDFTTGITHGVGAIIKALSESDDAEMPGNEYGAEMPGNEEGLGPDRWITRRIVASLARSR